MVLSSIDFVSAECSASVSYCCPMLSNSSVSWSSVVQLECLCHHLWKSFLGGRDQGVNCFLSLSRMSELIEKETEEYRKGDPDPFDDRHPGKWSRECMPMWCDLLLKSTF